VTIRGSAHDLGCATGIRRVEVAIAKHVGQHRCRFAGRDGSLGPPTRCSHRRFVKAKGISSWVLSPPGELPAGHYDVWARAVTRNGFRERLGKRNHRSFAVD